VNVKLISGLSFVTLICFVALSACTPAAPKAINAGLSSYFQPERIRTLAMMPLQTESGDGDIAERVMRELTVQILQLGRFELIDPYKVSTLVAEEELEAAELNDTLVRTIGRKLGADAILLGKVAHYRPARKKFLIMTTAPALGLNLRIISLKGSIPTTIWTVNDAFDGGDAAVQRLVNKSDRDKIRADGHFLIKVMCQEIARTLNF
jgi:hypothetical protein